MPEVFVAKASEVPDGDRRIIQHGAHDIGVFHWEGEFYAYATCACTRAARPAKG
jgi:nitrite reductase/ring-hydroxylating ferredoxin subunit